MSNQYATLSIITLVIFIILSYVALFTEPKKYGAGWYALVIAISLLILMTVIFLVMHTREQGRMVIEHISSGGASERKGPLSEDTLKEAEKILKQRYKNMYPSLD